MFFDNCWAISSAMTSKTVHGSSKSVMQWRTQKRIHSTATAYVGKALDNFQLDFGIPIKGINTGPTRTKLQLKRQNSIASPLLDTVNFNARIWPSFFVHSMRSRHQLNKRSCGTPNQYTTGIHRATRIRRRTLESWNINLLQGDTFNPL